MMTQVLTNAVLVEVLNSLSMESVYHILVYCSVLTGQKNKTIVAKTRQIENKKGIYNYTVKTCLK